MIRIIGLSTATKFITLSALPWVLPGDILKGLPGNISALEALNASKPIILNDILHFLGPIAFEKIMSVSNKLINVLLGGSVVSYLVLNSILLFFMVIVLLGTGELMNGKPHWNHESPQTPRFTIIGFCCGSNDIIGFIH